MNSRQLSRDLVDMSKNGFKRRAVKVVQYSTVDFVGTLTSLSKTPVLAHVPSFQRCPNAQIKRTTLSAIMYDTVYCAVKMDLGDLDGPQNMSVHCCDGLQWASLIAAHPCRERVERCSIHDGP